MTAIDFGTDVAVFSDLPLTMSLASGRTNVVYALARRWQTARGSLVYDTEYGIDVRSYVNASMTATQLAKLQQDMADEARKEERIRECSVAAVPGTDGVTATATLEDSDGPFDLVILISETTLAILDAGAIIVPFSGARPDVIPAVGPAGPPGPIGPTGSGGGGGGTASTSIGQAAQMAVNATAEEVIFRSVIDFGALGGSITGELTAQVLVTSGTGTYRLRLGGTPDNADGTVLATATTSSATYVNTSATATFANPTGLQIVKVTAQNSVSLQDARIRAVVVTFR